MQLEYAYRQLEEGRWRIKREMFIFRDGEAVQDEILEGIQWWARFKKQRSLPPEFAGYYLAKPLGEEMDAVD